MHLKIQHGDCLQQMAQLGDASVDMVVCDPPYGLEFMGKEWDSFRPDMASSGIENKVPSGTPRWSRIPHYAMLHLEAWYCEWLSEVHRVLKPGHRIKAFGGTRTFHRLALAMAQCGFEGIHLEAWCYGSGFPKSLNVSKALDRRAGAVREVIGSKRLGGNALVPTKQKGGTYGVGVGVAPPGEVPITAPSTPEAKLWEGWGTALKPSWEPVLVGRRP